MTPPPLKPSPQRHVTDVPHPFQVAGAIASRLRWPSPRDLYGRFDTGAVRYRPGNMAEVLVTSPQDGEEYVVTVRSARDSR